MAACLYLVDSSGNLEWYNHLGSEDGTPHWANSGQGKIVGSGWDAFSQIVGGGDGTLYAIRRDGLLEWYKHAGYGEGTPAWANGGQGKVIGNGWDAFTQVIGGSHGILYAIRRDGIIEWYNHVGFRDGTTAWANGGQGIQIGNGWDVFKQVTGGSDGVLYAIRKDGVLEWYNHVGFHDGTPAWANGGQGKQIGTGWNVFNAVLGASSGIIYGIQESGLLEWYKHVGWQTGASIWGNAGCVRIVGSGFNGPGKSSKSALPTGSLMLNPLVARMITKVVIAVGRNLLINTPVNPQDPGRSNPSDTRVPTIPPSDFTGDIVIRPDTPNTA